MAVSLGGIGFAPQLDRFPFRDQPAARLDPVGDLTELLELLEFRYSDRAV